VILEKKRGGYSKAQYFVPSHDERGGKSGNELVTEESQDLYDDDASDLTYKERRK
jgi:hypothetical protein